MDFDAEDVYVVDINGKERGFFIRKMDTGEPCLVIPDAGGMADMSPKFPDQLQWLEPRLEGIGGLKRIWPTIWVFETETAQNDVEDLLLEYGMRTRRHSSEFYTSTF